MLVENVGIINPADNFGNTPLHMAASEGNFEIFELIFQNVNDKNPSNINGGTPLHRAASKGHLQTHHGKGEQ